MEVIFDLAHCFARWSTVLQNFGPRTYNFRFFLGADSQTDRQSFFPRLPRPPHLLQLNAYPPPPLPRRRNISLHLPDFVHQDRYLPPYLRCFPVQRVPRVVACQLGPQLDESLLAGGEPGDYLRYDARSTVGFGAVETGVGGPVAGEEVMFFDGVMTAAAAVVVVVVAAAVSCFVGGHCVLDAGLSLFYLILFGYLMRWRW